jgi:hypothetical protein
VLFSKWNSFSRIGVYERAHGDWSLSPAYKGPLPDTRFMDIDSAASTPILRIDDDDLSSAQYLRYELTALPYHLKEQGRGKSGEGFKALVIGPGGGRDLASALVFGAAEVDAVEINPIIANEVMRGRFRDFSGAIYDHPRVNVVVDDGRSFVRQTADRYDVIQASLVDTWAATAAGAYTLTENTLYTVEAFENYLDRLTEEGVLAITRWVFDGLRLVSLAQAACEARGWDAGSRLVIVQHDRVATFLLKRTAFTAKEVATLHDVSEKLGFTVLYSPSATAGDNDYARLITATDRQAFHQAYDQDIRPTTDDRPFFFHTTKLEDQLDVAFGRAMLFGNGLSALLTLMGISGMLVAAFVVLPLVVARGGRPRRWPAWLIYFGSLGAGFMLIEVSLLQRFVLLLGHPVYSLTITLFSLLLGTGIGAALSRRLSGPRLGLATTISLAVIGLTSLGWMALVTALIDWAIPFSREARVGIAIITLVPVGMLLGIPMPAGVQLLSRRAPEMLTWAWGMNGALSVVGATLAIFIAMNWGFQMTLAAAAASYLAGLAALATTGALRTG